MTSDLRARFWKKVNKNGNKDCWLWRASKTSSGYGLFYMGKRLKNIGAHRASWIFHNGPIPRGGCVLHKCDCRSCVNPAHLFLGTIQDNNADRDAKGRGRFRMQPGDAHPTAILTSRDVKKIRVLHAKAKRGRTRVPRGFLAGMAAEYGITANGLSHAITQITWKSL